MPRSGKLTILLISRWLFSKTVIGHCFCKVCLFLLLFFVVVVGISHFCCCSFCCLFYVSCFFVSFLYVCFVFLLSFFVFVCSLLGVFVGFLWVSGVLGFCGFVFVFWGVFFVFVF